MQVLQFPEKEERLANVNEAEIAINTFVKFQGRLQ